MSPSDPHILNDNDTITSFALAGNMDLGTQFLDAGLHGTEVVQSGLTNRILVGIHLRSLYVIRLRNRGVSGCFKPHGGSRARIYKKWCVWFCMGKE
jgi:hypothetical protein